MLKLRSRPALIVSKDKWLSTAVANTLITLQYDVDYADSANKAINLIGRRKYLFVIGIGDDGSGIDLVMLYKNITKAERGLMGRFIFIPGNHNDELMDIVFSYKCHYLTRPYNPASMAIELEAMRTRQLLPETRAENRYNWAGTCNIAVGDKFKCTTMDISSHGIKLFAAGKKIITGTEAVVHLPDLGVDTKGLIQWNIYMGGKNLLGIDLKDRIDSEDLKKAVPFAS